MIATFPDFDLDPRHQFGVAFQQVGVERFHEAARFVNALPYGRNTDRADYRLVLSERRGTCSTKHALLAALAAESDAPVHLALGIYAMNEANTPGIGAVLSASGLDSVPEAHCYLLHHGTRVDLTWPGRAGVPPLVVHEERIRPDEIGAYKLCWHQEYLTAWAIKQGLDANWVWSVREACIAALASSAD